MFKNNWTISFVVVVQFLSHAQLFVTPWTAACQASLSFISWCLIKLMSIDSVMPSNHLILRCPLSLPSIFPSIRIFSNESVLHIGWPKHWHFNIKSLQWIFRVDLFLGLTGLISMQSNGLSRVFPRTTVQRHQFFSAQSFLLSSSHIYTWLLEKPQLWLCGPLLAQWCLFYFSLVCFTFSISYSVLPFHLVYVFQFIHLFWFFFQMFFLKSLSSVVEKLLCMYI